MAAHLGRDLLGRHAVAADLHDARRAAGDVEVAVLVEPAEVPGAVPVPGGLLAEISGEQVRARDEHLALLADGQVRVSADLRDAHLPERDRAADGAGPGGDLLERRLGGAGDLGHAVRAEDPPLEALEQDLGGRCVELLAAGHERAQRAPAGTVEPAVLARQAQHRRHEVHARDPALGEEGVDRLARERGEDDGGAGEEGAHHEAVERRRRVGHAEPVAVAGLDREVREAQAHRGVQVGAAGALDELRHPGRAGGEQDRADRLGPPGKGRAGGPATSRARSACATPSTGRPTTVVAPARSTTSSSTAWGCFGSTSIAGRPAHTAPRTATVCAIGSSSLTATGASSPRSAPAAASMARPRAA